MDHWCSLLNEKIVFITGGTGWIARHIAKKCHEHGARIVLADRRIENAETIKRELLLDRDRDRDRDDENERIFVVEMDVNDEQTIDRAVQLTLTKWQTIDVLVNTAAIFPLGEVEQISAEQWTEALNTNVRGYALVVKRLVPIFKEKRRGSIINFASLAGSMGIANFLPYATTKGAIIQMSRNLALDLGQYDIRVNSISPGAIQSPTLIRTGEETGMTKDEFDREHSGKCLRRLGHAEEIANLIVFLASDLCPFLTGTDIIIDGGSSTV